jgi:predicted nucleic acid-binding protein
MIVVADTSPINYLIQIDCDFLLPMLYGRILVPAAVIAEMRHSAAPLAVRRWLASVPSWLEVSQAGWEPDAELAGLGEGEREAIQLAEQTGADLLLIDERKGRSAAKRHGLRITGTLGVLLRAGEKRLIDPETAYRRLIAETTFRSSPDLESQFLNRVQTL